MERTVIVELEFLGFCSFNQCDCCIVRRLDGDFPEDTCYNCTLSEGAFYILKSEVKDYEKDSTQTIHD